MIVYVSIGNSDDKLTQREWSQFVWQFSAEVVGRALNVHGSWFSRPADPWQNACWCLEFASDETAARAKAAATAVRKRFRQDSAAWAPAPETEFI